MHVLLQARQTKAPQPQDRQELRGQLQQLARQLQPGPPQIQASFRPALRLGLLPSRFRKHPPQVIHPLLDPGQSQVPRLLFISCDGTAKLCWEEGPAMLRARHVEGFPDNACEGSRLCVAR